MTTPLFVHRLAVWLRIVALAARWPFRPCLRDLVRFNGHVWQLTQGVRDPIWTLRRDGAEAVEVHRDEFVKVKTPRNLIGSFHNGYQFYMGYWFAIWVHERANERNGR
jgi:hypothetical protein